MRDKFAHERIDLRDKQILDLTNRIRALEKYLGVVYETQCPDTWKYPKYTKPLHTIRKNTHNETFPPVNQKGV